MPTLQPSKAKMPRLHSAMTPHAAFNIVLSEILRQLRANATGILNSDDVEFVHQARVALRRLRSAQKAFRSIAPDAEWQSITTEIQWLATLLGQVRDLDVLLTETLPHIETAFTDTDFAALKSALAIRREHCRQQLRSALKSARYKTLLRKLQQKQNQSGPDSSANQTALPAFARQSLQSSSHKVARLTQRWQELDSEQRHDLRKRAKKLRYAAEFFSALFKRKKIDRYLGKLQKLQGLLGAMNDAVSAQGLLKEFSHDNIAVAHSAGLARGWLSANTADAQKQAAKAIRQLTSAKSFW